MKLYLIREPSDALTTRGNLYIEDKFECYTLEDPVRDRKINKVTAIPPGTYPITLWLSPKFGLVPRLHDVPGYTDILIHPGNYAHQADGCILVGKSYKKVVREGEYLTDGIFRSKEAFEELMIKLKEATKVSSISIKVEPNTREAA